LSMGGRGARGMNGSENRQDEEKGRTQQGEGTPKEVKVVESVESVIETDENGEFLMHAIAQDFKTGEVLRRQRREMAKRTTSSLAGGGGAMRGIMQYISTSKLLKTSIILLCLFALIPVSAALIPVSAQEYSVDAIAVWTHRTEEGYYQIWYSMYGHKPAIPKPIGNITEWKWWNGIDPTQSASPLYTGEGINKNPDVAFDREGNAMVVWSQYYDNIGFARWNGSAHEWSIGTLPTPTLPTPKIRGAQNNPTIAIDPYGNAIAVWSVYWAYTVNDETFSGDDLYYSVWNDAGWSEPKAVYSNTPPSSNLVYSSIFPQIAFIADRADSSNAKTLHKAILVWRQDTMQYDPWSYTSEIRYAIWNGSDWEENGIISGPFETCGNPEISSNMQGNATVVWSAEDNAFAAKWNGDGWEITNLRSDSYSPAIAYNYSDVGVAVYQHAGNIWYSIEKEEWINKTSIGTGGGPKVACLAHNKTIAVWENNGEIYFSRIPVVTWEQQSVVPGGLSGYDCEVAIAAHTGSPTMPLANWTFMAYMDGDNNLEGLLLNDFRNMSSVGSTSLINIIAQLDRHRGYDTRYGNWDTCKRFYIERNMDPTPANQLEDIDEADMDDDLTLEEFIEWTVEKYPASHYFLVLNDHGEGWPGCCEDQGSHFILRLTEISGAFDNALENKPIDIVGFDACLMGAVEVAYQIKDYCKYMVASENWVPWFRHTYTGGWPYDDILMDLVNNPRIDPASLASVVVDKYEAEWDPPASDSEGLKVDTLSAIDLSRINSLACAVSNFAEELRRHAPANRDAVRDARISAEVIVNTRGNYRPYVDLYNFSELIRNNPALPQELRNAAQMVMDNFTLVINEWHDDAPQVNYCGNTYDFSFHGLTIYFPAGGKWGNYDHGYDDIAFARDTQWDEFINDTYLPQIASVSGTIITLNRALASSYHLYLHVYDLHGNHIGINFSLLNETVDGEAIRHPEEVGIKGASYMDYVDRISIFVPMNLTRFAWEVDGRYLEEEAAPYEVTISMLVDNNVILEEVHRGSIERNTTHLQWFTLPIADFGDAPDPPYPSLLASNGARHNITDYEWLGLNVTREGDAKLVDQDEFDDGVEFSALSSFSNASVNITVTVSNASSGRYSSNPENLIYINGWFDWNGDGWSEDEHVFSIALNPSTWDGNSKRITVNFTTGNITTSEVWARIRLDYGQNITTPYGAVSYGEVEDYLVITPTQAFDTGRPENPYPSISGEFVGTIKTNKKIIATKLYTYACEGTGGHTEYARICNSTWCAEASWRGYEGDWMNISFNRTVVLIPYETYNITIVTGSYPQIHHTPSLKTENGWINCSEFTDANGNKYNDWIPAIMLWS